MLELARRLSASEFDELADRLEAAWRREVKPPHDLRHRRISLFVLRGTPIPRVSADVGHARGSMTLDVYAHVLIEASELEYAGFLAGV